MFVAGIKGGSKADLDMKVLYVKKFIALIRYFSIDFTLYRRVF